MTGIRRPYVVALIIIALLAVSLGPSLTYAIQILSQEKTFRSSAVLASLDLGVYWNASGNSAVIDMDWGLLHPASNESKTIYVRNQGNTNVILFINATDWSPTTALNYITLTSDYRMQTIMPNQTIPITLTLRVSASVNELKSFNFNVKIIASET